ncbi:MAG: hypothetical protein JW941_13615 [Candidatus Coatesbacteria bacterium]|nr:hypothetical protein [Candidatus Coatesbacteria bacterium]
MTNRRISTTFFAIAYGVGILAAWLAGNWISQVARQGEGVSSALYLTIPLIQVFVLVVLLTFIYKTWKAIQDGHASTSPAAAAWLLLIPIFHLYWIFRATWGFAKDYNKFIERHGFDVERLPDGLYLITSVIICIKCAYLTLGTILPLISDKIALLGPSSTYVLTIPATVFILIMIIKSGTAINSLPEIEKVEE